MTRPSHALYASIDKFSLIPSGPQSNLDFPSLAAIVSFTYNDIPDYLIFIRDYIRYILKGWIRDSGGEVARFSSKIGGNTTIIRKTQNRQF